MSKPNWCHKPSSCQSYGHLDKSLSNEQTADLSSYSAGKLAGPKTRLDACTSAYRRYSVTVLTTPVLGIEWKDTCNGLVKDSENHEFVLPRDHQPGNRSEGSGNEEMLR